MADVSIFTNKVEAVEVSPLDNGGRVVNLRGEDVQIYVPVWDTLAVARGRDIAAAINAACDAVEHAQANAAQVDMLADPVNRDDMAPVHLWEH